MANTDTAPKKLTAQEKLKARQRERAKQEAARAEAQAEQELADLDALDALEAEHGAAALGKVEIKHTPGLPTLIVVRTPKRVEMKRFRDQCKAKDADLSEAQEQLADLCIVYPAPELRDQLWETYPGAKALAAQCCILLAAGHEEARAKF